MAETRTEDAPAAGDARSVVGTRVAGGPISWGVCEVPGWGAELPPDRVLAEMASLGLHATEAGPVGYLGAEAETIGALLERHGLQLIAAFLPVVLHDRTAHERSVAAAHETGALLEALKASFLVSAVVVDLDWSARIPLEDGQWRAVFEGLSRLDEVAEAHGLTHVTHPHWGTVVERDEDVERLLEGSDVLLCLDTGHLTLAGTDTVSLARAAGGRIAHVHLKDVAADVADRLRAGTLSTVPAVQQGLFRPLGEGSAPVAETVTALEEGGYSGWYVLEQDCALPSADIAEGEGPIEDVRRSIEFLRSLLEDGSRAGDKRRDRHE